MGCKRPRISAHHRHASFTLDGRARRWRCEQRARSRSRSEWGASARESALTTDTQASPSMAAQGGGAVSSEPGPVREANEVQAPANQRSPPTRKLHPPWPRKEVDDISQRRLV